MAKKKKKASKSLMSQISVFSVLIGLFIALLFLALIFIKHNLNKSDEGHSDTASQYQAY